MNHCKKLKERLEGNRQEIFNAFSMNKHPLSWLKMEPYFSELLKEMKALRDHFDNKEHMFGPEALTVYHATVTMDQQRDFPFFPPRRSVWVVNDGPYSVLVALNNSGLGNTLMRRNEVLTFQFAERMIESVNFLCVNATATADIRMWTAFR